MTVSRLLAVAIAAAMIVIAASLAGCSGGSSAVTPVVEPRDEANREVCFASQQAAQTEVLAWVIEGNELPRTVTAQRLVDVGALSRSLVCPAGGEYTFNPVDMEFSCSVHGRPTD